MRRRQGFTLVELLVAIALIVLLVAIIADAFSESFQAFRHVKGTADLQERLRTTDLALRQDLLSRHFEKDRKVSDLRTTGEPSGRVRPQEGYFYVYAPGGNSLTPEGVDGDGIPSERAVGHRLAFTVHHTGRRLEDYHATFVDFQRQSDANFDRLWRLSPPGFIEPRLYPEAGGFQQRTRQLIEPYYSRWAEVAYFLRPYNPPQAAGGNQLYALYRRQKLLLDENVQLTAQEERVPDLPSFRDAYSEVSYFVDAGQGQLELNRPSDVSDPIRRSFRPGIFTDFVPINNTTGLINRAADDLLVPDVLSFQVQMLFDNDPFFTRNVGTYDSNNVTPNSRDARAIRITIRVWDFKTSQARQITVTQDL